MFKCVWIKWFFLYLFSTLSNSNVLFNFSVIKHFIDFFFKFHFFFFGNWIVVVVVYAIWLWCDNTKWLIFFNNFYRTNVPKSTGNTLLSVQFTRFTSINCISSLCTELKYSNDFVVSSRNVTATSSIIIWTGKKKSNPNQL